MNNAKRPQIEIKVIYSTDTSILGEKIFKSNISLSEILTYFQNNLKTKDTNIKSNYSLNGKDIINKSTSILDLITKNKIIKNNKTNQIELKIEIDEYCEVDGVEDDIFDKILIPSPEQPFQLIIYQPLDISIGIKKFPQNILVKYNLNEFDESSAYLNTKTYLFLSNNDIFCIMNKNNFEIQKYKTPLVKKNHSLLYIPDSFVLFAGGDTLETFFFDIEKSEFIQWGKMNTKIIKPSLFLYGDYVFSFKSFDDNDLENNYFERTNITSKNNKWEKIYPNYENKIEINKYLNSPYGVSKSSKGNILFVGGEGDKCLLYFPLNNKLFFADNGKNTNLILDDKNIYKVNDLYSIGIPVDFYQDQKIGLISKKDNSFSYINYNEITEKLSNSLFGKIEIKASEKNKIIKKVNKIKNNNPIDKKNEKQDKQDKQENQENNKIVNYDVINIDFNDDLENQEVKNNRRKKNTLYLPDSIMNNQIINRKVDLDNINYDQYISNNSTEDINNKDESTTDIIKIDDLNSGNEDLIPSIYIGAIRKKNNVLYIHDSVINEKITKRELLPNNNNKVKIYKKIKVLSGHNSINTNSNTNTINTNTINTNSINNKTINTNSINDKTINTNSINNKTINTNTINNTINNTIDLNMNISSRKKFIGNIGMNRRTNSAFRGINTSYDDEREQNNNTARNIKKTTNNSMHGKYKNLLTIENKSNRNKARKIKIDIPRRNNSNFNLSNNFYSKKLVSNKVSKEKIKRDSFKDSRKKNNTKIFNLNNRKTLEDLNENEGENISHRAIKIPKKKFCLSLNNSDVEYNTNNKEFLFDPNK